MLDKKGGIQIPRRHVVKSIEEIQDDFSLHDIWRIRNPNQQSFTWSRCSPFIFCRLDYWLISDKLHDLVKNVDIVPSIKSDHSAIFLELEEIQENNRGPGFWKLNSSLLANEEYKDMITNNLPIWINEAKDLKDPRSIWDWIKYRIRADSIEFSKKLSKSRRKREEELTSRYKESFAAFQNNPCDTTRIAMERFKNELEIMYDKKVEGLILRAKARWHEHGEKNSKYFLNLEKRNHIKKHIRKLHISGVISTDPLSIMNSQKQFYSKLYSSNKTRLDDSEAAAFFDISNLSKLSPEASEKCEGRITLEECQNIIKTFPLNKTPGNDGLPIEFYSAFWPLIGDVLIDCYNKAYESKEMSNSQRQGVITLIEKTGKDRTYLENWRPISLTNVDAKIASKVIATRIVEVLPEIIHNNQTGYVAGRSIGEAARSILDVMDYTKKVNIPGILLFIDFEKAFDSLEWNFMLKCLEFFGFGNSLTRWVETFYNNISSCIINNGFFSGNFDLNRGVRQGDPLSPYLFIIAIEILAASIRSRTEIKGIKIESEECKLMQYADDLTAFLSDIDSVQNLFKLLDRFEKLSGLKVNYKKTEAMWIGSRRDSSETPLTLKWCKTVKALGVHYTYNREELIQKNFYDKIADIKKQIHLWSWRSLSLLGKVSIIKSLLLPKLTYIFSILPTPPEFIVLLQKMIYQFLWKGPDKIARRAVINTFDNGGLDVTDLESSIKSLRLAWISKLCSSNSLPPWKCYITHLLKPFGGLFFLHCNYNIHDYDINPIFYSEMLQWWSEFRLRHATESASFDSIIWNNCNIRIDNKPLYFDNYMDAGVTFVSDLMFSLNNIDSFNMIKDKGLIGTNFLTWSAIRCSVPKHLRNLNVERNVLRTLEFKYGNKSFDPISSKSKDFYTLLIKEKAIFSRGFKKLMATHCLSEEEICKAFSLIKSIAFESFVRCFQFKILSDILFLNSRLVKIGAVESDRCTFCQDFQETLEHFFFQCPYSTEFWINFENFWLRITKEQRKLDYMNIIVGILDSRNDLLNYFIVLGKLYLWNCRRNKQTPLFTLFESIVKNKYNIEKQIASQNDLSLKKFQAKWKPFLE